MAGANDAKMAVAVAKAGGLGSQPCGMLDTAQMRTQIQRFQAQTRAPLNVNFFCHAMPDNDPVVQQTWKSHLLPYYHSLGIDRSSTVGRNATCGLAGGCELLYPLLQ